MPVLSRRYTHAVCAVLLACSVGALVLAHSRARAASVGQLQQQISAGQGQIQNLAGAVSAASSRLAQLDSSISTLEHRLDRLQVELNARLRELAATKAELRVARVRLKRLQALEARAEQTLAAQLVSTYEGDNPDLVTVVLESTGFQNLLERVAFAARIRKQDVQVIKQVRAARRAVTAEAVRLGTLEVRQQKLTNQVRAHRDELTSTKITLVNQQLAVARDRASQRSRLASAQARVADLRHQLSQLEAAQAAAARAAAASAARDAQASAGAGSSGGGSVAPATASGSGFAFPLPKSAASPPGTWSPDDGVDISAPGNTPEYAVCSGTIVLHGIGGFGPWAPVLHCDSSIGGYSYVYYGHAGPENQLPVGSHVSAGQVMSSIGPGIVGISTGPHLEIGFADSSGSPVGSQSAGPMLSLLKSAY